MFQPEPLLNVWNKSMVKSVKSWAYVFNEINLLVLKVSFEETSNLEMKVGTYVPMWNTVDQNT